MNSLYDMFDRSRIGWLHWMHERKKPVSNTDVIRLLEADPANGADPLLQDYAVRGLKGELDKRAAGRPESVDLGQPLYEVMDVLIELRAEDIAEERRLNPTGKKSRFEPTVQAAEEVARSFRLNLSGRSLLNKLSKRRAALNSA